MVLLRRLLGDVLRRHRQRQSRTLREVSAAARVSLGYLSEVERGHKEASSELLAAICHALDVPMSVVLREVSDGLAADELAALPATVPATVPPLAPRGADAPDGLLAADRGEDRELPTVRVSERPRTVAAA